MIDRKPYLRRIRELGYRFARQQKRTVLYRQPNGVNYLTMPRTGPLDEVFVRTSLLQTGVALEDVDSFIAEHSDETR